MENTDPFDSIVSTTSSSSSLLANVSSTASNIASQLLPDIANSGPGLDDATKWNANTSSTDDTAQSLLELYTQFGLDPQHDWKIPQYYSLPYQIIGTFFQGIIFIVGMCVATFFLSFFVRKRNEKRMVKIFVQNFLTTKKTKFFFSRRDRQCYTREGETRR